MKSLAEVLVKWVAGRCSSRQTYKFRGESVTCAIDWDGVAHKIKQEVPGELSLVGGLLPHGWYGLLMPSFAYSGKDARYIVIYPGNWKRRMFFAAGRRLEWQEVNPREVLATVLAHESQHIRQGVKGYGLKNIFVFPGLFIAPIAFVVSALLWPFGLCFWWVPLALLGYYGASLVVYTRDWREIDARRYAQHHSEEWEKFVSIAP